MTDRDLCGKYRLGGARVCFGLTKRKKGLLKNSLFNSPGIDKMFGAVSPRQTYDRTSRGKSAREKDELYSFVRSVRFFLLRLATPLD